MGQDYAVNIRVCVYDLNVGRLWRCQVSGTDCGDISHVHVDLDFTGYGYGGCHCAVIVGFVRIVSRIKKILFMLILSRRHNSSAVIAPAL